MTVRVPKMTTVVMNNVQADGRLSKPLRLVVIPFALAVAVAVGGPLAGCSKAKEKARTEIACELAEELTDGVEDVADEVRGRDLRDAQEDADELRRDFIRLQSRVGSLADAQSSAIEPLLAPADEAITALEAATTLDEMSAALEGGRSDIEALATTTKSTLRCD